MREHAVHFRLTHRDRFVLGSGKADHARSFANEIPRPADELVVLVEQMHVYNQVAREKLPRRLAFLSLFNFRHALGRDEHFVNQIAHLLGLDPLLDVLLDLVLLAGKDVDHEPLIFACECLRHG